MIKKIILYTTDCPLCRIQEQKLLDNNISYDINKNVDEMVDLGFQSAPMLGILYNDTIEHGALTTNIEYKNFSQALAWLGNLTEKVEKNA